MSTQCILLFSEPELAQIAKKDTDRTRHELRPQITLRWAFLEKSIDEEDGITLNADQIVDNIRRTYKDKFEFSRYRISFGAEAKKRLSKRQRYQLASYIHNRFLAEEVHA